MEELLELRQYIQLKQYDQALRLIGEMEEMTLEDKIHKIDNCATFLLLHLIKQHAEKRTTRSWDLHIYTTIRQIQLINKKYNTSGTYFDATELKTVLKETYLLALKYAAIEAFEGRYEDDELAAMVDQQVILEQALSMISEEK